MNFKFALLVLCLVFVVCSAGRKKKREQLGEGGKGGKGKQEF